MSGEQDELRLQLLTQAAEDKVLFDRTVRVLSAIIADLSFDDYQRIKAWAVAQRLQMKRHTVSAALRALTDRQYLQRVGDPLKDASYRLRPLSGPTRQAAPLPKTGS